jgi:hypothetical protein
MHAVTVPDSPSPGIPLLSTLPQLTQTAVAPGVELPAALGVTATHDESLLLAALEDIESRRAAIEWLLEADLLRACLV